MRMNLTLAPATKERGTAAPGIGSAALPFYRTRRANDMGR